MRMGQPMNGARHDELQLATLAFIPLFLFHQADHIRRGFDTASISLVSLGTLASYLSMVAITLVFVQHPKAAFVAVGTGISLAIGFIAVHWMPTFAPFSDSFVSNDVDAISWAASFGEVGGLLLLAFAGLRAIRTSI